MRTREDEILIEVIAAGAVERDFAPDPLTDETAEGLHAALMQLNMFRPWLHGDPDEEPGGQQTRRGVFRDVGGASFAGLTAIDSLLRSPRFGEIEEVVDQGSAAIRKALDRGTLPLPSERFNVAEAWEGCVFLLTAAFPPYCAGLRGSQAHLWESQSQLLDALVTAVLGIMLVEAA
jgi:hypothetical protein